MELRELLRGRGGVGHPAAPPGEVPPRSPLAGTADSMALRASATLERTRARDLPCAVLESHVERRAAAPFNPFSHRSLAIARYENGTRKSRRASRVRHRPRTSARNANPGGRLHGGSLTADVNPATLSFGPEAKQGPCELPLPPVLRNSNFFLQACTACIAPGLAAHAVRSTAVAGSVWMTVNAAFRSCAR